MDNLGMTKKPTLLAIFTHPDDEAFGTGGTLAHYATSGYRVVLACATRGEAGEISDPALARPEILGDVREAELRCSAHTMGFDEVLFLDYCDSGMDGTDMNKDKTAYINAPDAEVIRKLVEIIRDVKPDVVLTFEPYGIYGHPDHIAIHRHAVAAFHAAGDALQYPAVGKTWQTSRLFFTVVRKSFFGEMANLLNEPEAFKDFKGWPEDQIHVEMDVSQHIEAKWNALLCHATQFGADNGFRKVPREAAWKMLSHETFSQAWPELKPGEKLRDLFDGLG
jgi:LmbE family N-acetylglucosaminyl deacetylase